MDKQCQEMQLFVVLKVPAAGWVLNNKKMRRLRSEESPVNKTDYCILEKINTPVLSQDLHKKGLEGHLRKLFNNTAT